MISALYAFLQDAEVMHELLSNTDADVVFGRPLRSYLLPLVCAARKSILTRSIETSLVELRCLMTRSDSSCSSPPLTEYRLRGAMPPQNNRSVNDLSNRGISLLCQHISFQLNMLSSSPDDIQRLLVELLLHHQVDARLDDEQASPPLPWAPWGYP